MELPGEQTQLMDAILLLERMIDQMHAQFDNYRHGEIHVLPDWQRFERQLLFFSRRRPHSLELSNQLDRVLFKFQARKRVWLRWAEEFHQQK
jgi:hypothetical protein